MERFGATGWLPSTGAHSQPSKRGGDGEREQQGCYPQSIWKSNFPEELHRNVRHGSKGFRRGIALSLHPVRRDRMSKLLNRISTPGLTEIDSVVRAESSSETVGIGRGAPEVAFRRTALSAQSAEGLRPSRVSCHSPNAARRSRGRGHPVE